MPKEKYGVVVVNDAGTYGLVMTELIAPIVKAIQELYALIDVGKD